MKYRTDLILGEAICILIFFRFPDSGLSVLNVCIFIFDGVTVKTEHTMNNTTDLRGPCIIYMYIQVVIMTLEGES